MDSGCFDAGTVLYVGGGIGFVLGFFFADQLWRHVNRLRERLEKGQHK